MGHQLNLSGDNMELTPSIKELTSKKTEHLHTICNQISHIDITFKVNKLDQIANGIVKVPAKNWWHKPHLIIFTKALICLSINFLSNFANTKRKTPSTRPIINEK